MCRLFLLRRFCAQGTLGLTRIIHGQGENSRTVL